MLSEVLRRALVREATDEDLLGVALVLKSLWWSSVALRLSCSCFFVCGTLCLNDCVICLISRHMCVRFLAVIGVLAASRSLIAST